MNINPKTSSSEAAAKLLGKQPKRLNAVKVPKKIMKASVYMHDQYAEKLAILSDSFGHAPSGKKAVSHAQIIQAICSGQLLNRKVEDLKKEVLQYLGF